MHNALVMHMIETCVRQTVSPRRASECEGVQAHALSRCEAYRAFYRATGLCELGAYRLLLLPLRPDVSPSSDRTLTHVRGRGPGPHWCDPWRVDALQAGTAKNDIHTHTHIITAHVLDATITTHRQHRRAQIDEYTSTCRLSKMSYAGDGTTFAPALHAMATHAHRQLWIQGRVPFV